MLISQADPSANPEAVAEAVTEAVTQALPKNPVEILQKTLQQNLEALLEQLPSLIAGIVILVLVGLVVWVFGFVARKILKRLDLRPSLNDLILAFGKAVIWVVGFLIAATVIFPGLTPSKVLGAAGLASVAVGLAFKDIFQNFFAGILLLWKFPFEPGDLIECAGVRGVVVETRLRLTTVRSPEGELIIVPNSHLISNPLDVVTSRPERRTMISTGVAYKEDLARARDVVAKAVESCESVNLKKQWDVFVSGFGDSSMDLEVYYWTSSRPYEMKRSRSEVSLAIKEALDREGIEIPFPYRTMTFDEPLRIEQGQAPSDS